MKPPRQDLHPRADELLPPRVVRTATRLSGGYRSGFIRLRRFAPIGTILFGASCLQVESRLAQEPSARGESRSRDSQDIGQAAAIRRGNAALKTPIVTVVDKPQPFPTGNAHDYVSYAIYFWPDTKKADGLPFVSRDGERNEKQVAQGDAPRFRQLFSEVSALAEAWQVTKNPEYARKAGDWLRAWMVTPETRMTPHLQNSQIRLGRDANQGQSGGIIDGARMHALLDAIRLLDGSPALSTSDQSAVREWLSEYDQWLTTSEHGLEERTKANNHGVWYRCQTASLAAFLGRDSDAREILTETRQRIAAQIEPDGRQPLELKRVDGFSYSVYNLDAFFHLALLGEKLGVDLWDYEAPNGGSLSKALDFLRPYSGSDRKAWPGNQKRAITGRELDFALTIAGRVWPGAGYGPSAVPRSP